MPDSWEWIRLNLLISINGGYAFKSENYTTKENGIRVLRIFDFNEYGFNQKRPLYHSFDNSMEPFLLNEQDIIMCMTGGTVGKSYFVKELLKPMVVNQRVADIKVLKMMNVN